MASPSSNVSLLPGDSATVQAAHARFDAVFASPAARDGRAGIAPRAFADLGWDRMTAEIAARCTTDDGVALAAELGPLPAGPLVAARLREVDDLAGWLRGGDDLPARGLRGVAPLLVRATKGDILLGPELLAVADVALAADKLRVALHAASHRLVDLAQHGQRLVNTGTMGEAIRKCFDPAGDVADSASPALASLRRKSQTLRNEIQQRLDKILRSPRYEGILQDEYVTIRDERYVVPVRAGERGDFPGIVHGHSGSGATLFIEPEEIVGLNNQFRINQIDIETEIRRILQELTQLVARNVRELEANRLVLTYVDVTRACARLAVDLDLHAPQLDLDGAPGRLELRHARHPILALRERAGELRLVANDIEVPTGAHLLVISGPNTGGKTVTLKTLGLFAIMVRAGLPLSCSRDSVMPLYRAVYSDIGDEQALERDLSTFSAHVRNIASFLPDCGQGALVLLDELFAGTDPEQGGALGRALLEELVSRGAWAVVTTHLESLKTLAFEDSRFACASVGFDVDRFEPTYALRLGVPGSSYALRIAERLGLSRRIVESAQRKLGVDTSAERESLILRLENEHLRMRRSQTELDAAKAAVEQERTELERRRRELAKRDREMVDEQAARMRGELRELEDQLRALRQSLATQQSTASTPNPGGGSTSRPGTLPEVDRALQQVREASAKVQQQTQAADTARRDAAAGNRRPPRVEELRAGVRVFVRSFGRVGEVVEPPRLGDRVLVQMGGLRTVVPLDALLYDAPAQPAGVQVRTPSLGEEPVAQTLDLRGANSDEALEQLDVFLDRAVRARRISVVVIHGHGTGVLRRAVRDWLSRNRYGVSWRPGQKGEGGDGVTVVEIERPQPPDSNETVS